MIHTHKPTMYTEAAFDLVLLLNQSKWFVLNDIHDPRLALELFALAISLKYGSAALPIHDAIFSNEELNRLKKIIRQSTNDKRANR